MSFYLLIVLDLINGSVITVMFASIGEDRGFQWSIVVLNKSVGVRVVHILAAAISK